MALILPPLCFLYYYCIVSGSVGSLGDFKMCASSFLCWGCSFGCLQWGIFLCNELRKVCTLGNTLRRIVSQAATHI